MSTAFCPVRRSRGGFTLVEILVVLAVIAVLAGVLITTLSSRTRSGQAANLIQNLKTLSDGIGTFRGEVGRYPSQLQHLSGPPPSGAVDPCSRTIPSQFLAEWRGPYVDRLIGSSGLPSGNATIANALRRVPNNLSGGLYGIIYIDVSNVDRAVATEVDRAFDGTADLASGSVTWTQTEPNMGSLSFGMPVYGC